MDLKGKKALFIVASRGFRDEELIEPKSILESYGAKCIIANETGRESVGMLGKVVDASMTLDKVDVNDYDAIIFVGGSGSTVYFTNEKAISIVKQAKIKGKVVAAICLATGLLAKAGIVKDKTVTGWSPEAEELLVDAGGKYTGESVEVSGRMVTGYGPKSAKEFGEKIARLLTKGNAEED
ncbi:DJ-1/PfpI family protein [Candidatus Woesearchaeota archaeon]|nr:DJ-1/PfpI family protein [Candidatus Woesearchaeota archaeon]